jgi:hypothetical protein
MIKKTIIANKGLAAQGKSASIISLIHALRAKYPNANTEPQEIIFNGDVQVIINLDNVKIGIESQGDPKSRLFTSLPLFVEKKCDIIICACRNRGQTVWEVEKMHSVHDYDIVWVSNPRLYPKKTKEQNKHVNLLFVDQAMKLIEAIINQQI